MHRAANFNPSQGKGEKMREWVFRSHGGASAERRGGFWWWLSAGAFHYIVAVLLSNRYNLFPIFLSTGMKNEVSV